MGYQEDCTAEAKQLVMRMDARYSRAANKRREPFDKNGGRLPMDIADRLERMRTGRVECEFGVEWNHRSDGALP